MIRSPPSLPQTHTMKILTCAWYPSHSLGQDILYEYASNAHDSCAKADGMSLFLRHLCVVNHWMHNTYATFATTSSTSALTHGHPYGRHCQSNKSFSINEYNQQWTDAGGRAMILSISPNSICTHRYDKHTYIYIRNSIL